MRALSIKQPWANLIAGGAKTIETRTWYTSYRGKMLIVSSKKPKIPPAGYVIAIADLVDCRPMTKNDEQAAMCEIYPRAYSWVLSNVVKLDPFPLKGTLGLFHIDKQVEAQIEAQVGKNGPSTT
jgi:hypothetical protein